MNTELIEFIIKELKMYKEYKALLTHKDLSSISISAVQLSDMPKSVTNKFNSITENQALYNPEATLLHKHIAMIENWLWYLNDIQRFVITEFYINELTYERISRKWEKQEHTYFTRTFWINKRKASIHKICNLLQMCTK